MSTHEDLSSLPPAILRAALEASEKRVQRERDKIKREMRQLQKRLDELEKGADAPEQEPEKAVASGSKGKKRQRVDSPDDESEEAADVEVDQWYDCQWPIAKARKSGERSQRHHVRGAGRGGYLASGTRTLAAGFRVASNAIAQENGATSSARLLQAVASSYKA